MLANFSNLITFSRGSNATVTDASGRLTYAANNLLTNSQDFESANWQKNAVTVTANAAVAPDSTATADQIAFSSTSAFIFYEFSTTTPNVTYIFSVWLRAAAATTVILSIQQSGGSVSNSTISLTTEWQRFFVSYTTSGSPTFIRPRIIPNSNTPTFLAWGAQLEAVTYQTTPSPYVSTSVANLLGFSEAFDNAAWTKSNSTIVPGAAQNPINNLWNAQKLMENTVTGGHNTNQSFTAVSGTSYTMSCYIKAGERTFAALGIYDSATKFRVFNLTTGSLGSSSGITGSSITAVGNGWYRCSITITAAVSGLCYPYVYILQTDNFAGYAGDGNSGIYIYGAQLSNSGSLDPYVPTPGAAPSSTAYYGPRFDYDPVTLAPKGLLIEEQRTNLLTYSEQFDNAAWTKTAATITANSAVAPDGTTTADTITEDTTAVSAHRVFTTATVSAAAYTASIYVKAGTRSWCYIRLTDSGAVQRYAYFNVSTGTLGTVETNLTASITPAGNGWYRCSATVNVAATSLPVIFAITDGNNSQVYTGNGTGSLYFWGAQLEAGSFATSYIPTVASTVTRSADVAAITGSLFSQWYRQDEGAFVAKFTPMVITSDRGVLSANDGSGSNDVDIRASSSPSSVVATGGVSQAVLTVSGAAVGVSSRLALSYAANDFGLVRDGGTAAKDTTGAVPTVTQMQLGNLIGSTAYALNGYIRSIQYIPNRISDTQLQSLTAS